MPARLIDQPTLAADSTGRSITADCRRWDVLPELDESLNLQVRSGRTTVPVLFRYDIDRGELLAHVYGVHGREEWWVGGEDALVLRNWRLDIKHGLWPVRAEKT